MSQIILTPTVAALSDELGLITAEIKRLTAQRDSISAELKLLGAGRYAGHRYETLVYYTSAQAVVNWKAVAEHMKPSRQLITAHTTEKAGFLSAKPSLITA